ncbi:sulfotransferase [Aureimonas phyllosphaerae]|uniref:sulfotransferase n=1 Tax=Aureimonas phyllosphaerae TaxID=1166078 RepID=UPI003A5BA35B
MPESDGHGRGTQFITVLYVNRSGSTLFSRLVSERFPGACMFPELSFPLHLLALRSRGHSVTGQALHELIRRDPRIEALGIPDAELKAVCETNSSDDLGALFDALAGAMRGGRPHRVVLFKLETLLGMAGALVNAFPGIKFIHVVRDPRAVASSMLRTPVPEKPGFDMARGSAVHAARHWRRYIRQVETLAGSAPVLTIGYESLGADLPTVAARLEAYLNLSAEEPDAAQRLNAYATAAIDAKLHQNIHKPFMRDRVDGWSDELSPRDVFVIEMICQAEMAGLGYEPARPRIGNRRVAMAWAQARHMTATIRHAVLTLRHYMRREDALQALKQRARLALAQRISRKAAPKNL